MTDARGVQVCSEQVLCEGFRSAEFKLICILFKMGICELEIDINL